MTDLKPCRCGGTAEFQVHALGYEVKAIKVICNKCFAASGSFDYSDYIPNQCGEAKQKAIEAWEKIQPVIDWKPIEDLTYREDRFLICNNRLGRSLIVSFENKDFAKDLILINGYIGISLEKVKQDYTHLAELTPPISAT